MHLQSCCFAYNCFLFFFHVLVAVRVVNWILKSLLVQQRRVSRFPLQNDACSRASTTQLRLAFTSDGVGVGVVTGVVRALMT